MIGWIKISMLICICLFPGVKRAGAQDFVVKKVPFSSGINDEFSPVFYRNGIVFSSNMKDNSIISYTDAKSRLFKLFFVEGNDSSGWKNPVLLSRELTSGLNDGPATFSNDGLTIYYSRNNNVDRSLKNKIDTTNKLGIYSAELKEDKWTNITSFRYNDERYTFCTPSLSPDDVRLYFSSDKPGGYGGMDLYYCERTSEGWGVPLNLGPEVNTAGNEAFPFASLYGKLYFSSDGHAGSGKKDIYYTSHLSGKWVTPVHMDSVFNSPEDDFGLVIDTSFKHGYFSSRRLSNDDIFSFTTPQVEFSSCDTVKENNYCFTLYDERHDVIDSIPVTYSWNIAGIERKGTEVKHCFPGPGKYDVRLTITDDITGDTITRQATFTVELEEIEQAYIRSPDVWLTGTPLIINGAGINLQNFTVTDYMWDFGEGFKPGGSVVGKSFREEGDYTIKLGLLGLTGDNISARKCYMKNVRIYNSYREMERGRQLNVVASDVENDLGVRVFFMDDITDRQRTRIRTILGSIGETIIVFDKPGIMSLSNPLLDSLAEVLKSVPGIRLEIAVYEQGMDAVKRPDRSEMWAGEISSYFRDKLDGHDLRCKGLGRGVSAFGTDKTMDHDGMLDIIFMKK